MIRCVRPDDAEAIAAIYAPIVERTMISFEEVAPSADEIRARIEQIAKIWPWLVYDDGGGVLGYVYASQHRARAAYRWSVDVSAYVREDARGRGLARSLYEALFRVLAAQGYHRAFAGIGLPNDASIVRAASPTNNTRMTLRRSGRRVANRALGSVPSAFARFEIAASLPSITVRAHTQMRSATSTTTITLKARTRNCPVMVGD